MAGPGDKPSDARLFAPIARKIRQNRVKGFEALRDNILENYELLTKSMPAYSALKIAIEADRHALFAQVAEGRGLTEESKQQYQEFMQYLAGEVEIGTGAPPRPRPKHPVQDLVRQRFRSGNREDPEEEGEDNGPA